MVVESVVRVQLQTLLLMSLMREIIRIHLKLITWNLSMIIETLKVAWLKSPRMSRTGLGNLGMTIELMSMQMVKQ